jgi:hypothetical protein
MASIQKLADLEFDVACFAHGGTVTGDTRASMQRLAERVGAKARR